MSKKESVYIETTVVSYLTAWLSRDLIRAAHQQITQEWWQNRRNDFEIFVSEFVILESSAGDAEAAEKRLAALEGIALLDINLEVENLAKKLVADKAVPEKSVTDALHIAVAAVHAVDYLLSWRTANTSSTPKCRMPSEKCARRAATNSRKFAHPKNYLEEKYDLE